MIEVVESRTVGVQHLYKPCIVRAILYTASYRLATTHAPLQGAADTEESGNERATCCHMLV
jgi:hypothetical protein